MSMFHPAKLTREQSQQSNARWKEGHDLFIVTFVYTSLSQEGLVLRSHSPFYGPEEGADLVLQLIDINRVEITDHFLVNWEHDQEGTTPQHNGYVAFDADGNEHWKCQYPQAAYGQVSTEADYHFTNMRPLTGQRWRAVELCHVMDQFNAVRNDSRFSSKAREEFDNRRRRMVETFNKKFPDLFIHGVQYNREGEGITTGHCILPRIESAAISNSIGNQMGQ